jgi:hypothetical protein
MPLARGNTPLGFIPEGFFLRSGSFPFEAGLHVGKLLDNGFNSLAKARASQVLDQLYILYLAMHGSNLLLFLQYLKL